MKRILIVFVFSVVLWAGGRRTGCSAKHNVAIQNCDEIQQLGTVYPRQEYIVARRAGEVWPVVVLCYSVTLYSARSDGLSTAHKPGSNTALHCTAGHNGTARLSPCHCTDSGVWVCVVCNGILCTRCVQSVWSFIDFYEMSAPTPLITFS